MARDILLPQKRKLLGDVWQILVQYNSGLLIFELVKNDVI
jgi:hypothetical protein